MVAALTALQNYLTESLKYIDRNYPNGGGGGGGAAHHGMNGMDAKKEKDDRKWENEGSLEEEEMKCEWGN